MYSKVRPLPMDSCRTRMGKYLDKGCSREIVLVLLLTGNMSLDEVLVLGLLAIVCRPDSHFKMAASEPMGDFSERNWRIIAGGDRASKRLGPSETLTL